MAKDYSEQKRNLKRQLRELNAFDKKVRKKRAKAAEKVTKYEEKLQRAKQDHDILIQKEWNAHDKWFVLDEKLQKVLKNEKRSK
jgi:chromosome segregation ATPase